MSSIADDPGELKGIPVLIISAVVRRTFAELAFIDAFDWRE